MDDLSGLNWTSTSTSGDAHTAVMTGLSYPSLRPTPPPPLSGRSTPQHSQSSNSQPVLSAAGGAQPSSKPSMPANDSFSNLISFGPSKQSNNLSLQEQQKQARAQKLKQEESRRQQYDAHFSTHDSQFWDSLGANKSVSSIGPPRYSGMDEVGGPHLSNSINKPFAALASQRGPLANLPSETDDDLLSTFNSASSVDTSSHFPPPLASVGVPERAPTGLSAGVVSNGQASLDDDDPFGLSQMQQRNVVQDSNVGENNEDDVLGLLGRPASEFSKEMRDASSLTAAESPIHSRSGTTDMRDRAVAELVDMGFPAHRAQQALAKSSSDNNVQAAVGWLLNEAHQESKQKPQGDVMRTRAWAGDGATKGLPQNGGSRNRRGSDDRDTAAPVWMRDNSRSSSTQRRTDSRSPAIGEKDVGQYASEIGTTLFKSANSLWKTSTKKVQKAVAEFQYDSDSNQPKWMRESLSEDRERTSQMRARGDDMDNSHSDGQWSQPRFIQKASKGVTQQESITDEAMMLEPGKSRPALRNGQRRAEVNPKHTTSSLGSSRSASPAQFEDPANRTSSQSNLTNRPRHQDRGARGRISRQVNEEQSSQAYVSPARRKKAPPVSADIQPDIFRAREAQHHRSPAMNSPCPQNIDSSRKPPNIIAPQRNATPLQIRPKAPPRNIPPVSDSALSTSYAHRSKGTDAFKRGDFSAAQVHYTNALSPLPNTHPITIIIFCNRALANLKVGEPKAAVADADQALSVIGASRGEGESINSGNGEREKNMREFLGKALMRKAEALEQLEKWSDAAQVWKEALEAGVGGANSVQGRNRCEKAIGGKQQAQAPVKRKPQQLPQNPPPRKPSALDELNGRPALSTAPSAEAVTRLRAANAAAEKVDDEKFALADIVDAKLTAWKAGKQDNLRALLGSLDTVLWPEAGWKKVGMHELVLATKVKIMYMKGIAKVHPDKLPTTATTEQKMISGAVFSTLNEAWDRFKKENGL